MITHGCTFCVDAGQDFDWCRVCGRGRRPPLTPEEQREADAEAKRIESSIHTLNKLSNLIVNGARRSPTEATEDETAEIVAEMKARRRMK